MIGAIIFLTGCGVYCGSYATLSTLNPECEYELPRNKVEWALAYGCAAGIAMIVLGPILMYW